MQTKCDKWWKQQKQKPLAQVNHIAQGIRQLMKINFHQILTQLCILRKHLK